MYVCTRNILLLVILFVLVNTKYLRWLNTSMVDNDCLADYDSDGDVCVLIK